jgi:hypothetical protein
MPLITDGLTIPPANTLNGTGASAAKRQLPAAADRAVVPLVYGEDRISGLILNVLSAAGTPGTLLVQVLWCHACDSINDLQLNDAAMPAGATATHYTGAQTTVNASLEAAFAAQGIVGQVRPLTGYAWSLIAMPAALFDGSLNVTARIRGRKVYDPSLDSTAGGSGPQRLADPTTWAWSDVPALCLGDFLASSVYGCGLAVDWASVSTTSQANRAIVPGTVSEQRRLVGVSFIAPAAAADVAETLRAYAGCFMLPGASGVRLVPDQDAASVATYRHAYGEITAISALELRDLSQAPTAVEVIYTDTSATPWRDASATAQLDGAGTTKPWRLSQVRLPGIHRYGQALREATERLNKLWLNDITTTLQVFDIGIRHDKGDIVTVDHPLGLSMTPMRVADVGMPLPGRWELALVRHSAAAYSDIVASAAAIQDAQRIVPAPESLGIKLNVSGFAGTVNYNEAYIHAVDANGNALDAPGAILVNGVATAVPNGSLFTNEGPVAGYIVWDSAGATFSTGPGMRPYVLARRYQGAWQYDDNTGWVTFTPLATHWIIGTLESGAPDTGFPGSAPGLIAASMWAAASTLNSLEANADAAYSAAAAAQSIANSAASAASAAQADADAANALLADISSDGKLAPVEKTALRKEWDGEVSAKAGIEGQATAYSITTEKTAYVNALVALGTYLNNGSAWTFSTSSPPLWISDAQLSATTTVAGATLRSTWKAYTDAKQALLNAVADEAAKRANWDQVSGQTTYRIISAGYSAVTPPATPGVYKQGALVGGVGRSYTLARIRRSDGAVVYNETFDVWANSAQATALAAALNGTASDHIVVVHTGDEPQGNRLFGALPAAMYRCGASRAVYGSAQFKSRSAYVLVGIPGCGEGNGAEAYQGAIDDDPNAWVDIAFQLVSGNLVGVTANFTPRTLLDYGYTGSLDATRNTVTYSASAPSSPADGDIWIDTSVTPRTIRMRLGGTWQQAGTYVNGTAQITDDANLGLTALWSGVAGSGKPDDYATRNQVYFQDTDPGAVPNGSIWISSTKAWQRVSGAWQPYVGVGSVGTGEIAADAATEITQDNYAFGGAGSPGVPTVQRSITVTPAVACKVNFTAIINASAVNPDGGNYLYWAVSAGGGADVTLGNCYGASGSKQTYTCVASFAAAAGVALEFKLISNRNPLNPAIVLYDSSMRVEVIKR